MGGWASLMYEVKGAALFPTVPGFGPLCPVIVFLALRFCDYICADCVQAHITDYPAVMRQDRSRCQLS